MLKFLKSRRTLLVVIIVTVLGWAGYSVSEQQVNKTIDMVLVGDPVQEEEKPQTQITSEETIANQPVAEEISQTETSAGPAPVKEDFNRASHISPERRTHILHGDITGGGHLYGTGAPCKSEFPKHWGEETIIKEVELIAANDNLNWEQQRNGYYVTEQDVGTVKVRVVKARNGEDVITAYPINVPRNPCPANDN